jgi:hypothetical protein
MNGDHNALPLQQQQRSSASPAIPRKKRTVHGSAPVWAQSGRGRTLGASRNFSIKQQQQEQQQQQQQQLQPQQQEHGGDAPSSVGSVNGTNHEPVPVPVPGPGPGPVIKAEHVSRHTSPEVARSTTLARDEPTSQVAAVKDNFTFGGQPFPWEPTIEGSKPIDVISRSVADFLAVNVVQGGNPDEMRARGAQFEIEAKLGIIIDKLTNDRIDLRPAVAGECIIPGGSRTTAFRSSMTEVCYMQSI